jgi:hypothetical protein
MKLRQLSGIALASANLCDGTDILIHPSDESNMTWPAFGWYAGMTDSKGTAFLHDTPQIGCYYARGIRYMWEWVDIVE